MILKFYKDPDNRWYVDLPTWEGSKADLEMVAGADIMLEYIAEGENTVLISLNTETSIVSPNKLEFIREAIELGNGAFYKLQSYNGIDLNLDMWLCDVTKFVFGEFPKFIYLHKV